MALGRIDTAVFNLNIVMRLSLWGFLGAKIAHPKGSLYSNTGCGWTETISIVQYFFLKVGVNTRSSLYVTDFYNPFLGCGITSEVNIDCPFIMMKWW